VIGRVLEFKDLQRISGFDRRSDVERWAQSIGLKVRPCRGGVWTTEDAMNNALGVATTTDETQYPVGII